jgi:hypothetical protein
MSDKIKIFGDKQIRMEWNEVEQDWYLSIVDVISILTDQSTQRGASNYWEKLRGRMKNEGNELLTICQQLKMQSSDGKYYKTDAANSKGILRLYRHLMQKFLKNLKTVTLNERSNILCGFFDCRQFRLDTI